MPYFKYTAKDEQGKTISATTESKDKESVVAVLRQKRLIPLSIQETKNAAKTGFGKTKVKLEELVIFSRQLATMVDSGIPLVQALDVLSEQIQKAGFKQIVCALRDNIETGSNLSDALARHPQVFSALFVNMVRAGETSGMLDAILERLANYLEKVNTLQHKVKSSLTYPILIISMAIIITSVLIFKVVPTFKGIFETMGGELPQITQMLITFSDFARKNVPFLILGIFIFSSLFTKLAHTERGKKYIDRITLRLPIIGELLRKIAIARFSRTLSTLVKSGVPILTSLQIVGKTSGNKVVEQAVEQVRASIREGENIAAPLAKSGVFPPMVTRMIEVGEQTGELEKMLSKIADFYEEQVDTAVNSLTSLIEPIVILFLGIVIGGIVAAMFMPIFKITELIQ